ncbi:hypothetical protein M8C21_001838 [Ambrosia artemisiifolia]|uniref:Transposase DDE domain-containing protein n=1 Tax=Ambrosia artemisiifolia TaxID=4212 RepID=A0AAD5CS14_AMBAR|nr:hypothetical protein M8C21_001838 [Ambrosia artemisiifolia]
MSRPLSKLVESIFGLVKEKDGLMTLASVKRDIKLLPTFFCGALKIRRSCRKKIHERITAVSG